MRSFASAQDFGARLRRGASASTCVRAVGRGLRRKQCLLTSNVIKCPQITLSSFSRANRLGFSPSPAPRRLDSDPFPLTKPRAEFSLHYFRRVIVANHHAVPGAPSPPPASPQGPRVRRSARSVTSQSANTSISRTIPSPPRHSPFPPLSGPQRVPPNPQRVRVLQHLGRSVRRVRHVHMHARYPSLARPALRTPAPAPFHAPSALRYMRPHFFPAFPIRDLRRHPFVTFEPLGWSSRSSSW
jgi:hypothetical protein